MAKNRFIFPAKHFEKFITHEISTGKNRSANEKESLLLKALIKGEKSKRFENFSPKAHLAKLHRKHL